MTTSYRGAQTLIKKSDEPGLRAALEGTLSANASNHKGWSLLMLAAVEGDVPVGQLLIEKGANIAAINLKGETALSIATQKGHQTFIDLLNNA
jgi:ankyrin repeat protein